MKRKSDFSKKYLLFRLVPFFEPTEESKDLSVDTRLILKIIGLIRPRVRCMYKSKTLIITQRVPKETEKYKYKKEIIRALYREADNLFSVYGFLVNIRLEYE
jgi:hypothetical protein